MLTVEQIRDKIFELPFSFENHYRNAISLPKGHPERIRYFLMAKRVYNKAVTLSVFVDLPESDQIRLFGNRAYKEDCEELTEGLFREEAVNKASLECILAKETEDEEDYRMVKK